MNCDFNTSIMVETDFQQVILENSDRFKFDRPVKTLLHFKT